MIFVEIRTLFISLSKAKGFIKLDAGNGVGGRKSAKFCLFIAQIFYIHSSESWVNISRTRKLISWLFRSILTPNMHQIVIFKRDTYVHTWFFNHRENILFLLVFFHLIMDVASSLFSQNGCIID